MKFLLILSFLLLFSPLYGAEKALHKTIIIGSFLTAKDATVYKKQLQAWAENSKEVRALQKQYHFYIVVRESQPYWVVAIEPLRNKALVSELYELVKWQYHDAFLSNVRSDKLLKAYARGEIPPQIGSLSSKRASQSRQQKTSHASTTKSENAVETVAIKSDVEDVVAKEILVEGETSTSQIIYLLVGIFFLSLIVVYLLVRQRKSEEHVKDIEDKVNTLSSSNDALNSVNEEYKGSMEEQEDLIQEMSGKLKVPAKSILGRAERILETELNDKQSIELRNIHDSGQTLFAIVDDLLDFMKIRSNKLEIKEKPFDINELLDLIVRSVLERIEKKDVEVIFDIEKNVPPRIIGDPVRIGQVLTNLLENGIKFTNAGDVKLRVKSLSQNDEEIQLMFEIIDTGMGIPQAKLDDIFTPFYQINNNNSAGLGLSISKALVEMMGGEILISTEVNRGSTFTFVLGLKVLDKEEKRHYRLPDSAYKPRRILIVDYHDNAAIAMRKLLVYFHNEVDIFSQAELERLAPDLSQYDILFVSEKLLTFDLIKQIDPLKSKSDVKVVVVGSMLHKINNSNIVEKLADGRLMKPVNQQNIFDLLVAFYGDELVIPMPKDEDTAVAESSMPRIVIERTQKQDVKKEDFSVFKGARILVAEDNTINQKVIQGILRNSEIELDIAGNGKIAVEMAAEKEYDLVLMDINMPVMDGYEATERLKASLNTSALPVVALSGNTMPQEIAQMQACGLDDRLEKPIKIEALYSVFSKYLEQHIKDETEPINALPNQLHVFDEALERCGDDVELYKELVDEFIKLYKNSDALLSEYVDLRDATAVKELSHDIKGVSSNIGAYALANAAQKINESSIQSTSMPLYVKKYKEVLRQTLNTLSAKLRTL